MAFFSLYGPVEVPTPAYIVGWATDVAVVALSTIVLLWKLVQLHLIDGKKTPRTTPYFLLHLLVLVSLAHNVTHQYYCVTINPFSPSHSVDLKPLLTALNVLTAIMVIAIHHIFLRAATFDSESHQKINRITLGISVWLLIVGTVYEFLMTTSMLIAFLIFTVAILITHTACMLYFSVALQRSHSPLANNFFDLLNFLWRSPTYRVQVLAHLLCITVYIVIAAVLAPVSGFPVVSSATSMAATCKIFFFHQLLCASILIRTYRVDNRLFTRIVDDLSLVGKSVAMDSSLSITQLPSNSQPIDGTHTITSPSSA